MKVLGVNISHHASSAFYDGKLKHYYEEDRFKKIKYWEPSKEDYYYNTIDKLLKRISPKKGTALYFNSNFFHASSPPIKSNKRIVINFVFNI